MEEQDPELMKKGQRAQIILYVVMAVFAILPFIVLWWMRRGGAH